MVPEDAGQRLAAEFRRQFLEELKRRSLTMADVARAYGCSNENIAQLVGGRRDLKLETAGKLCTVLGLRLTIKLAERETAADLLQGIGPVDDEPAEQISRAIRDSREEARKLDAEDIELVEE